MMNIGDVERKRATPTDVAEVDRILELMSVGQLKVLVDKAQTALVGRGAKPMPKLVAG